MGTINLGREGSASNGLEVPMTAVREWSSDAPAQRFLVELSARFLHLPADQTEREIGGALDAIAGAVNLDAAAVAELSGSGDDLVVIQAWARKGQPPAHRNGTLSTRLPFLAAALLKGKEVRFETPRDLPASAAVDRASLRGQGIRSGLWLPMAVGGSVAGAVGLGVSHDRSWDEPLVAWLRLVADVLANALARRRSGLELAAIRECLESVLAGGNERLYRIEFNPPVPITLQPDQQIERMLRDGVVGSHDAGAGMRGGRCPADPSGRRLLEVFPPGEDGNAESLKLFVRNLYHMTDHESLEKASRGGEDRWFATTARGIVEGGQVRRAWIVKRDIHDRKEQERRLRESLEELQRLRERMKQEGRSFLREAGTIQSYTQFVGRSPAIRQTLSQIEHVAPTGSTVLLQGETGTGKELLAAAIHDLSPRRERTMVRVNCAGIPVALIESELFGREKGAYTGALARQIGRFELAHGSTIFLDEVAELPPEVQVKLLRVLQEKEIERLGSPHPIKVDVRVIAATNRDLERAVAEGRFRQDLYYRLNVFPVTVPPLRDRRDDIQLLTWAFVTELSGTLGKHVDSIDRKSLDAMHGYSWPGNVRELRNMIERSMILSAGPVLTVELPGGPAAAPHGPEPRASNGQHAGRTLTLAQADADHIRGILASTGWRVRGKGGAAEVLGLKPSTLESRMAKLGIRRPSL